MVTADFNAGSFSGSSGAIQITNLPFTVSNNGLSANGDVPYESWAAAMTYNISFNTSYHYAWYLNPNSTAAYGIASRSGTTWADWDSTNFHSNSIYMTQSLMYTTT